MPANQLSRLKARRAIVRHTAASGRHGYLHTIYTTAMGVVSRTEYIQCCILLHITSEEAHKVLAIMTFAKAEQGKIDPFRDYCIDKAILRFSTNNQAK